RWISWTECNSITDDTDGSPSHGRYRSICVRGGRDVVNRLSASRLGGCRGSGGGGLHGNQVVRVQLRAEDRMIGVKRRQLRQVVEIAEEDCRRGVYLHNAGQLAFPERADALEQRRVRVEPVRFGC